jgi:hypothetical protein
MTAGLPTTAGLATTADLPTTAGLWAPFDLADAPDFGSETATVREGVFGFAATTAVFAVLAFEPTEAATFRLPPAAGFFATEDFREACFAT